MWNPFRIFHKASFVYTKWSTRTLLDQRLGTVPQPSPLPPPPFTMVAWEPPPTHFFKLINFNDSFSNLSGATTVIIRDSNARLCEAFAYNVGRAPILVAGATTLQCGVLLARQLGIHHLIIEGDKPCGHQLSQRCSPPLGKLTTSFKIHSPTVYLLRNSTCVP